MWFSLEYHLGRELNKPNRIYGGSVDVVIIGGGVIGMLTARELLKQNATVKLIDKSGVGTEASWAGGGIVSPLYPWTYSDPITSLANWAQQYYPALVKDLIDSTGIDPQLNPCGLLMMDRSDIEQAERWAQDNGKTVSRLSAKQVAECEPSALAHTDENLWLPYVGNIRNPRLLQSLKAGLSANNRCKIVSGVEVDAIERDESNNVVVSGGGERWVCQKAVVCTGAWTQKLLHESKIDTKIEIAPVKGQMLVFEPKPNLIKSIILHQGKYLIPRLDGRILVGSTLEHEGFNKETTGDARELLLSHAYSMVPELKHAKVEAHWAGLRPGCSEGLPYIGRLPGWENLYVNAGHFRNGLVLAPASARLMSDLLVGREPIIDPSPYDPAVLRQAAPMH